MLTVISLVSLACMLYRWHFAKCCNAKFPEDSINDLESNINATNEIQPEPHPLREHESTIENASSHPPPECEGGMDDETGS